MCNVCILLLLNNPNHTDNFKEGNCNCKWLCLKKRGSHRILRVLLVLKCPDSVNEVVLWLKSMPWSVTQAFPLCSPVICWACGAQPNPSSSKWCGQQSARCDHQLITHYPPDQAQPLHRCEASLVLNTLAGRPAADVRLPQTGFTKGSLDSEVAPTMRLRLISGGRSVRVPSD